MVDTKLPLKISREGRSAPTQAGALRFQIRTAWLPAITAVAAISAASATAAMTATPTATTATSASVSAAPASTAASALCLGTCFIHHEVSPAEILTVQGVHRAIRVFVIGHFNEGEPARLSRKPVANQIDTRGSYTDLREPLVELFFCRGKRKITDIELLHLLLLLSGTELRVAERAEDTAILAAVRKSGPPQAPDRGLSGLLHPPGNLPLLQLKLSRSGNSNWPGPFSRAFALCTGLVIACGQICSPPERPYAWHDDGFSVDAAHDFGALRQDFFAHRDRLPQTGQVHHAHVLRRLLPAGAPPRGGVD